MHARVNDELHGIEWLVVIVSASRADGFIKTVICEKVLNVVQNGCVKCVGMKSSFLG